MRSIQSLPKDAFHALARKQFKALAAELGLQKGEYDLRTNKAGPAVLGETTLHTDKIYVQVGGSASCYLMYRTCDGRKDYCGRQNWYMQIDTLRNVKAMANHIRALIGTNNATSTA